MKSPQGSQHPGGVFYLIARRYSASAMEIILDSTKYLVASKPRAGASGFTVIEMMIVLAIVSVLAGFAIPSYVDYVSKSQVAAALSEITGSRGILEEKVHEGITTTEATAMSGSSAAALRLVGLVATSSSRCSSYISTVSSPSSAAIQCVMVGNSAVDGETITWSRDGVNNIWSCATTVPSRIAPMVCTGV